MGKGKGGAPPRYTTHAYCRKCGKWIKLDRIDLSNPRCPECGNPFLRFKPKHNPHKEKYVKYIEI